MNIRTTSLVPAMALLLSLPPAWAQDEPPTEPETFSFEFPGGSLADYCAQLRELAGDRANIVAPARATEVKLPAMKLTQVTAETAVAALSTVAEPDWRINYRQSGDPVSTPVYGLQLQPMSQLTTQSGGVSANDVASQVISLADLVRVPGDLQGADGMALEPASILTALQNGLSLSEGGTEARIVYHEETSLLFVRSTRDDLRLAENTVRALQADLERIRLATRNQRVMEARQEAQRSRGQNDRKDGATEAPEEPSPDRRR